jgi:hypothetical protein
LYFSGPDHMRTVFTSDYVRTVVGPDCEAFGDFGAANAMLSGGDIVILSGDTTEGIDQHSLPITSWKPMVQSQLAQKLSPVSNPSYSTVSRNLVPTKSLKSCSLPGSPILRTS